VKSAQRYAYLQKGVVHDAVLSTTRGMLTAKAESAESNSTPVPVLTA